MGQISVKTLAAPGSLLNGNQQLDIFLGSGTSLIAAERVGRRFRGLDIDPAYVDLAIQRWTDLTGKEPELVQREDDAEVAA